MTVARTRLSMVLLPSIHSSLTVIVDGSIPPAYGRSVVAMPLPSFRLTVCVAGLSAGAGRLIVSVTVAVAEPLVAPVPVMVNNVVASAAVGVPVHVLLGGAFAAFRWWRRRAHER